MVMRRTWVQEQYRCIGNRKVNGICFHHKKPWVLVGYDSGEVDIRNYNAYGLMLRLEAHHGPVQAVNFHISCPIFVSGGCDGKIKLWDYDDEICSIKSTFTLEGHSASVNDVQFHHDLPWIVSASDDCTVRLWNWLSRNCIAVLTEHTSPVTSSSFHPKHDLALSSSLDRRICVWDITDVRDASFSRITDTQRRRRRRWSCLDSLESLSKKNNGKLTTKNSGARLKNVLSSGAVSGVVRAIFHPTLPFVFSASDDSSVHSWKIGDSCQSSDYQTISLRNRGISCLAYSTKLSAVMSSLDGENLRLFNAGSESGNKWIFNIHHKDLSCVCAHPTKYLFAVSHANGMSVHRFLREPPAFSVINDFLYHIKDKRLWFYDYSTKKEARAVLGPIEDLADPTYVPFGISLSCSQRGDAALICVDRTSYRLVRLNFNKECAAATVAAEGDGLSTVFVAQDRFAVLIRHSTPTAAEEKILSVRNLSNEIVSESVLPCDVNGLSSHAGLESHLLCLAPERVVMFDLQRRLVVAELVISSVRFSVWEGSNTEATFVALVGAYFITLADRKLMHLSRVDVQCVIEGGCWDEENKGVFVYKSWKYINYCLVNGESGTVMLYKEPFYITRVSGSTIYGLDEEGQVRSLVVDATEYIMKASILNKDYMKQCCHCLY